MNIPIVFLSNLLSSSQVWGGVATILLFVLSFVAVHAVKLSSKGYIAYRQPKERNEEEKEEEEKKTEPPAETQPAPVYYLVEKKRVRKKPAAGYAEPKRIQFRENDN